MSSADNAHSDIDLSTSEVLKSEILLNFSQDEKKQSDSNNNDLQESNKSNDEQKEINEKSTEQTTEPILTSDFEPDSNEVKNQSEIENDNQPKETNLTSQNEEKNENETLKNEDENNTSEFDQNSKTNSEEIGQLSAILKATDQLLSTSVPENESKNDTQNAEGEQPLANQITSIASKLESETTTIVDASSQTDPLPISVSCQTSFQNLESEIIESQKQDNRTISESNIKEDEDDQKQETINKKNTKMEKQVAIFNSRCSQSRKFDRTLSNRNSSMNSSRGMYAKPRKTANLNAANTTPPRDKNRHFNFEISQSFSPQLFTISPSSSAASSGRQNEKSGLPIISMKGLATRAKTRSSLSSLFAEPLNSSKSEKPHYSNKNQNNKLSTINSNLSSSRSCVIKKKTIQDPNNQLFPSTKTKNKNNEGELEQTIDMLTRSILPENKASTKSSARSNKSNKDQQQNLDHDENEKPESTENNQSNIDPTPKDESHSDHNEKDDNNQKDDNNETVDNNQRDDNDQEDDNNQRDDNNEKNANNENVDNIQKDDNQKDDHNQKDDNQKDSNQKDDNIQKDEDNDVIVFNGGGTTKELADDFAKVLQPICVSNSFEEDKNDFDTKIIKKLDSHGNTTEINFTDNESQGSEVSSGHKVRELSEMPDFSKLDEEEDFEQNGSQFEEEEETQEERKERMVDDLLNNVYPEPPERAPLMSYIRTTQVNSFLNEDYQNAERLKIAESILRQAPVRSPNIEEHYATLDSRLSKAEENLTLIEDEYKDRLAQFDEDRVKANEELEKSQQEDMANFESQWDSDKAMLKYQKASPHLLELRFRQKRLALAQEYQYASEVKQKADELQMDETQDAASNASESLKIAYAQMIEKHKNQQYCFDNKWDRHRHNLEAKRDDEIQIQQRVIEQLKNKKDEKYERRARCHILTDRVYESTPVSPRTKNSLNIYRRDVPISRLKLNSSTIVQSSLHPKKQRQRPFTPGTTKRYSGYY